MELCHQSHLSVNMICKNCTYRTFLSGALLMCALLVTRCAVPRSKSPVVECTQEDVLSAKISSNKLVRTEQSGNSTLLGIATENGKPVTGIVFLTNVQTQVTTNEFISSSNNSDGRFSLAVPAGIYSLAIQSETYTYRFDKLELGAGEVRELTFELQGYTKFVERSTKK